MAADNRPEIILDGDVSPFRQKLREAAADLKRFGDDGEHAIDKINNPLNALREKFVMIGAILGGGAVFAEAVKIAKEWNEQAQDMGNAMGVSATEAGNLKAALAEEGVEMSTFMGAAAKLANNLKNDESALQAVGLATRDVAGNLRPLNELTMDAIELVGQYKAGTDRAVAASELFGKGFEISGDLAKINSQLLEENIARQRELGAVVTNESLAAFGEYDKASKGVSATFRAMQQVIGQVLMPVLATLGDWFNVIGPYAIVVIKGALGGLASMFHLVTTGVTVLWETINAMVVTVTEPIRAMSMAIGKAMTGDFYGAAEEIRGMGGVITGAWGKAFDEMAAKAQSTRERIGNIFGNGTEVDAPAAGGKSANGLVKPATDKAGKKEAEQSLMQYYEAALAQEKLLASEKDALREYTKGEELAFWQTLLTHADLAAKDRIAIEKKVSDLTLAVRRQAAVEQKDIDAENQRHAEVMALSALEAEQAAAQAAFDLGTVNQQQMLEMDMQFEQRKTQILRDAMEQRLLMADQDPNLSPAKRLQMQHQIEEFDRQHLLRMKQLQTKSAVESNKIWGDLGQRMSGLWDKGIQSIMNGTFKWRNAFKAIGMEMVSWFATSVVGDMVKKWIAGKATKLAADLGFIAQEKAAQAAGSAAVVSIKTGEATAVAGANAVEAGTGAAASQASIPFVGPILAIAAMGAIFAAVSQMSGKIKSASRGYSIPKGVNPLTQLHEEEMVLPSEHANAIRRLTQGEGGGQSQQVTNNYHVQAWDSRDVGRFLNDNKRHIAQALASAKRDGYKA